MTQKSSFTGRRRNRRTTFRIRAADQLARLLITLGGAGTIIAVLMVCLFLVSVTVPLFSSPKVTASAQFVPPWGTSVPVKVALDEYQMAGWALLPDGTLIVFRADDGVVLEKRALTEGATITAASFATGSESTAALGFEDGTVRLGRVGFTTRFLETSDVPGELRGLAVGKLAVHQGGLMQRVSEDQFRLQTIETQFADAIKAVSPSPIAQIDHVAATTGTTFCVLNGDGELRISSARERTNLLTGQTTFAITSGELPIPPKRHDPPRFLRLAGLGDNVFLAWDDGQLLRYDTRDLDNITIAETVSLFGNGRGTDRTSLTTLDFLLGRGTLLAGDSLGRIGVWFRTKPHGADTVDGATLVKARDLAPGTAAVTALTSSARSRIAVAGYASGEVRLYYVTGGTLLSEIPSTQGQPITSLAVSPKADGLLLVSGDVASRWHIDMAHPEVSFTTLFRPVWYEGFEAPSHVWQSSSGTDDFEIKLGLVPLIFGTIKATFYSMLLGAPLALLAAVYSNAFLTHRARATIKPTIELMAGLPSVVLGFLAAMLVAPLVEHHVPAVIISPIVLAVTFMLGAHLWQLLPRSMTISLNHWRFPIVLLVALPVALLAAWLLGPFVESAFFADDIKRWLDGHVGTGIGAWLLITLPLCGITFMFYGHRVNGFLGQFTVDWGRSRMAVVDLAKFVVGCLGAFGIAWFSAWLLSSLGFDPRGTFVARYDQRNAMIVGFVMAFAIIPIIYTISDDALSAVPETLRSASLGAGATPWQTTMLVIVPTAMSGLFSAVMIGLGRAVGETMIVLMAAGNTPVMNMNIFEGFRTLSANIAVELPEAVKDSTHYRTLFLAALALFAMTFVINTIAETVRLRFRKRAYEL